ncbi:hypothetical protein CMUS01_11422 [Colletotrichum musicola]|uniref:Glycosyltransferase family 31 n=1 Tax=Colletotrichum musicola TaxID=2175873 RepID=A0A8H6JY37_9PEZI|nr:hypothetical protein CMUS01_11422 [Colletotrichum musicola]
MQQPLYTYQNHARALHAATFLLVLLFVLIQLVRSREDASEIIDFDPLVPVLRPQQQKATLAPVDAAAHLGALGEKHGLTRNVSLFSRRVRAAPEALQRRSMTDVQQVFSDAEWESIRLDDKKLSLGAGEDMSLPVAKITKPGDVDASDLLFGVVTTYNRISHANDSLVRSWRQWLTDGRGSVNGASVVVALYNTTTREAWATHDKLLNAGIDATVLTLNDNLDPVSRYFEVMDILLEVSKALADDGHAKKYIGLVEDDIFFPTPGQLLSKLSKFDAQDPYYIGVPSERPDWTVKDDVAITHGGGAVFLTPPAAVTISNLACYSPDSPPFANTTTWDAVLHECVSKHTKMPLHVLSSFYSPRDALYNMQAHTYDLGVSPLALRHAESRHQIDASRAHFVAAACGEACFLQRFRFADDWVLVNGYSLTHYCAGFEVVPMSSRAALQGAMQYGLEAELPVGDGVVLDETDAKKEIVTWRGTRYVWSFLDAVVGNDGEVWQVYARKGGGPLSGEDEEEGGAELDSVIVLIWEH